MNICVYVFENFKHVDVLNSVEGVIVKQERVSIKCGETNAKIFYTSPLEKDYLVNVLLPALSNFGLEFVVTEPTTTIFSTKEFFEKEFIKDSAQTFCEKRFDPSLSFDVVDGMLVAYKLNKKTERISTIVPYGDRLVLDFV